MREVDITLHVQKCYQLTTFEKSFVRSLIAKMYSIKPYDEFYSMFWNYKLLRFFIKDEDLAIFL